MKPMTLGLLAVGGAALAYAAYGKKARFLGDKAELKDAVSIPIAKAPLGFGFDAAVFGNFGTTLPNATKYVFRVDKADAETLTGQALGLVLTPPGAPEQFVLFPNQALLNQQGVALTGQRKDVVGIVRGTRQVLFP